MLEEKNARYVVVLCCIWLFIISDCVSAQQHQSSTCNERSIRVVTGVIRTHSAVLPVVELYRTTVCQRNNWQDFLNMIKAQMQIPVEEKIDFYVVNEDGPRGGDVFARTNREGNHQYFKNMPLFSKISDTTQFTEQLYGVSVYSTPNLIYKVSSNNSTQQLEQYMNMYMDWVTDKWLR